MGEPSRLAGVPSLDATWAALAVLVPVAVTASVRTQALDLAYQLRAGADTLGDLSIVRSDTFTYTVHGEAWLNQQWGAQVLLAAVHPGGGWFGLALLRAVAVAVTVLLVYRSCRASAVTARAGAMLTLSGWFVGAVIVAQLRPQTFAVVLFALSMWSVTTRARAPGRLWLVPLVTLVWVNVHGSFPLVFVWLGLAALDDVVGGRRSSAVRVAQMALVSLGATLVNPYGARVWSYLADLATNTVVSGRIGEWGPPSLQSLTGVLFWSSLLLVVIVVARRRDRLTVAGLVGLAAFAALSLLAVRGVVWWALAAPVLIAPAFARRGGHGSTETPARAWVGVVLIAAVAVFAVVGVVQGSRLDPATGSPAMLSFAPEHLVAAVRSSVPPGSRVFVSQFHASWAEYSAPELFYGVDSRVELFPEEVWQEYFAVSAGVAGWDTMLDRAEVDALLLDPDQADGLIAVARRDPGWKIVQETVDGAVFVRS
jgi:hypothetical protein